MVAHRRGRVPGHRLDRADYELYPQLEAYADAKYGDEANGKDAVLDFVNFIGERVRGAGQEAARLVGRDRGRQRRDARPATRRSSGGRRCDSPAPQELMDAGHRVLNAGWWPLYYVTGGPLKGLRATERGDVRGLGPVELRGPLVDALGRTATRAARASRSRTTQSFSSAHS